MHNEPEEIIDDIIDFIHSNTDELLRDVSDEPLGCWWNEQIESIGERGIVLMRGVPGGAEIQGIAERDWLNLVDASTSLIAHAGRALGLEEWATQTLAAEIREATITRIIETLSGELAAAESLPLVDGEVEFEPPY